MDIEKSIKLNHPYFEYAAKGFRSPIVLVFSKPMRTPEDPAKLREYDRNEPIVRKLGGYMAQSRHDYASKPLPPFSKEDVKAMLQAARIELGRKLKIVDQWNGEGRYTFSIGCRGRK